MSALPPRASEEALIRILKDRLETVEQVSSTSCYITVNDAVSGQRDRYFVVIQGRR